MREIKFRAWHAERKNMTDGISLAVIAKEEENKLRGENEEYVFLQYTGLKDKNGKEIYEGDIVLVYGEARVVEYKNAFWNLELCENKQIGGFGTETESGGHKPLYRYPEDWIEIIGNIYENPELQTSK